MPLWLVRRGSSIVTAMSEQPPPPSGQPISAPPSATPSADQPSGWRPVRIVLGLLALVAAPVLAIVFFGLFLRYANIDGYSPVENQTIALVSLAMTPVSFLGLLVAGVVMLATSKRR